MNNPPETDELRSAGDAGGPTSPGAGAPAADVLGTPKATDATRGATAPPSRWRRPSLRLTAVLAASMLAIGVAVGAAIGPAPSPSFAINRLLPTLLPSLLAGASHAGSAQAHTPAQAPSSETEATSPRHRRRRRHKAAGAASAPGTGAEATTPAASSPTGAGKPKTVALPPVSKVWLIELSGASFSEATKNPSAAPYTDTTAVPDGTLLAGWSSLQASSFANDAALLAASSPQVLDTIVQPPCPEGTAGTSCTAGTPGALTAGDEFLKATLPTITSTPAYKENGLVVVTFASVASAAATGLPAGAATATLTSQPSAGALLISPFVAAGAKSSATLDTTSPKQTLEKLLRR